MVWLVNMADTDRPNRNSTDAAPPQQEAQEGRLVCDCGLQGRTLAPYSHVCPLIVAVASPTPSSLSQDDGGFTPSWVSQQEHQLGTLQSTEHSRREIQEMPSARPAAEDDDEESGSRPQLHHLMSCVVETVLMSPEKDSRLRSFGALVHVWSLSDICIEPAVKVSMCSLLTPFGVHNYYLNQLWVSCP